MSGMREGQHSKRAHAARAVARTGFKPDARYKRGRPLS
jgi:hypothetical protein